ncbi:NAD(P)/FAD-dependent oxidoreductase [Sphingomonas crocodyli]|uniref:NAD(P)/FAD-dependent oxidoreductase n=1 Tax=Sphingomonas crocodyli TaxID=1979270 RepID=A0A437M001_9SPHN|nr:FAD-dependent oxidoreductase [Sphingomonas crocodyli]RVT90913.1 NAD(P)/FAD-dependent oxidoreductase [Sphingomonas crocodyli]
MQKILIIGSGFAGVDAALSAARLRDLQGVSADALEIAVVSPAPILGMRPRLYEAKPETLSPSLTELFDAIEIRYVQGVVERIDTGARTVDYVDAEGTVGTLDYDRLVLAAGSRLFRPDLPGLSDYGFSVDSVEDAVALDKHLHALADKPDSIARNTIVVGGGGFTGLEVATEMPGRLREILGADVTPRIVIVERAAAIGPDIGDGPRPAILAALEELGIETKVGSGIASLDAGGATLSSGERIEAATVVWSAGMKANPITTQIPGERDNLGRLIVDRDLRVPGVAGVFATGDVAKAASDDEGNFAAMSCQHAKRMGAFAGNNAAAELLGVATEAYHQRPYVTCLDLGAAGALFTTGWDRQIQMTGEQAKKMKQEINQVWIYPPRPNKAEVFAYAVPANVVDLS